jgi:hypothetical protein
MKRDAPIIKSSEETVLYTSLSLFIILLAFFLVLNSHSEFEDSRVGSVLSSVEQAFTTRIFDNGQGPSLVQDLSGGRGEGFALKDLAEVFKSSASGIEPYLLPSKGFLSLEIGQSDMQAITNSLTKNNVPTTVAATILRVLKGDDKSIPSLQMEIWIAEGSKNQLTVTHSADELIQSLIARGIDDDRISLGISSQVTPQKILLLFRPYSPYGVKR